MHRDESVTSFRRGLAVINSFGAGHRQQSITDVATRTGLTRAAARRFLLTLCAMGYARTNGKYFELTPAVLELSQSFLSGLSEIEIVRDVLVELTRSIGESASAAMLEGCDIVYVARSPARHRIMTTGLTVGTRLPAHATSMGQALLSTLHPNRLDAYFKSARLDRFTERTLPPRGKHKTRLEEVRTCGYALVSEELEMGLRSIAIAIRQRPPAAGFAINISAPAARVPEDRMLADYLPHLKQAAGSIRLALDNA